MDTNVEIGSQMVTASFYFFTLLAVWIDRSSAYSSYCGSIHNNPSTTICCNGLVYVRSGVQPACCGNVGYDARSYLCCSGNIVRKDPYKAPRCCGSQGYDLLKDQCVSGNRVERKRTNLGSHCCMTDNGWKCCNKGEGCCSYTGSGQVDIPGFRPVCCEKTSYRDKAECCANIKETTGVLPSCCDTSNLKPKCCQRWDGGRECCPVYSNCCPGNSYNPGNSTSSNPYGHGQSRGRGVPIKKEPVVKPTQSSQNQVYYSNRQTPKIPQCCLTSRNRPSCCYYLKQSVPCCNSQRKQDSYRRGNQGSIAQQPQRKSSSCCTSTRRRCCPKITSSVVSRVAMQPCCYSMNKPGCCYTSQAYSANCCTSKPTAAPSNYIPANQGRDTNLALEALYSNGGRGDVATGRIEPKGVPLISGTGQDINNVRSRGPRINGRPEDNRRIDGENHRRGHIHTHEHGGANRLTDDRGAGRTRGEPDESDSYQPFSNGRNNHGTNNRIQGHRNRHDRHHAITTVNYNEDIQVGISQNDIQSYEYCCYLEDRRDCCKQAYMATGTLPYCCSASIQDDNMRKDNNMDWGSQHYNRHASTRIKTAKPAPEPKFIPEYAPFGNNGQVDNSHINSNQVSGFDYVKQGDHSDKEQNQNIIKGIVINTFTRPYSETTTTPKPATKKNVWESESPGIGQVDRKPDYTRNNPEYSKGSREGSISQVTRGPGINENNLGNPREQLPQYETVIPDRAHGIPISGMTTDRREAGRKETTHIVPTIYPLYDEDMDDELNVYSRPYLNDSIYIPRNIIHQAKTSRKDDKLPVKVDNERNSVTKSSELIYGEGHRGEINQGKVRPFENEYQQPDTLDNPFIPSTKKATSRQRPDVTKKKDSTSAKGGEMPEFDPMDPSLEPDLYNYYLEGENYPEYMMCGDEPYMMSVFICCDGVLRYRYGVRPRCCGTEAYDDFTYKCCDGVIMRSCDPMYEPSKTAWGRFA